MRKLDFLVILFVVFIVIYLAFAVLHVKDTHKTVADSITPKIIPHNPGNSPVPVTPTREHNPKESRLEIYDPDRGTVIRIYRDQDASGPLKNNVTAVLQAIKFQEKCSRPYNEFQTMKNDYRYVTSVSADNVSGRYCYNNISAACQNITADEFTILLKKKAENSTDATCSESGSIFAYRQGTDARIWRLADDDNVLLESLNRNIQEIIEDQKL